MSNDQQLAVLTGSKNMPSFAKSGRGADLNKEAAAGTGGESINRISLKQSRFRLIVGGEQVSVIKEPHMDVVIVRANPGVSRAYYKKKYDPNADDQSPDCYSSNGVVPDADVQTPQCERCADCPHSQWGSKISEVTGAKVKACSEVKRIAIVPASNVDAPMFQIAIPAASLKVFGGYVRMLSQATPAIPYNGVITRVSFDEESDFPKLAFKPIDWISDEQYQRVEERFDSEEARRVATIVESQAQPQSTATKTAPTKEPVREETQVVKDPEPEAVEDPWGAATQAAEAPKEERKSKPEPDETVVEEDPWGAATQAAQTQKEEPKAQAADAFEQSGWEAATEAASETKDAPPSKAHEEQQADVIEGDDIDAIFGAGFDDNK